MNDPIKIQEQNAIAISMLNHLLNDNYLKSVIHKFGVVLAKNILQPLMQKIECVDSLDDVDEKSRQNISHLMLHHTNKGRQYDGFRMEASWEKFNNKEGVLSILKQMNELLSDFNRCTTIQVLSKYFKSMYEISFIFVKKLPSDNHEILNQLYTIILPTTAERETCISFTEIGTKRKQFAATFGLFATSRDLIDETQINEATPIVEARITGKSLFKEISTKERYRITFTNYLLAKENYEKPADVDNSAAQDQAEANLLNQIQKMINLDIPMNLTYQDLEKVDKIARANETWIEKIARQDNEPLVAGISGTIGRLIIALIHFNLIRADQQSINELQILANCVAAQMAFQGHHSFVEVHESARRAIDALLITNSLPNEVILKIINHPFYRVGDSFLHHSYADKILKDSQEYSSMASMMPSSYLGLG